MITHLRPAEAPHFVADAEVSASTRYYFIDALRGIAASGVLLHHLYNSTIMETVLCRVFPISIVYIAMLGATGVQIFFVLSGFVIAHALGSVDISGKSIRSFILRRHVRLDPPYWSMVIITLLFQRLQLALPSLHTPPMPDFRVVLENLLYLQKIVRCEGIVGVAWTLCIEVQFYLLFIALLSVSHIDVFRKFATNKLDILLVFGLGICSLAYNAVVPDADKGNWFISYWYYFAAGVLCCWALKGKISQSIYFCFLALFLSALIYHGTIKMVVGFMTAILIYAVGRRGHLSDWLRTPVLQYLGRISYSLYLVHFTVLTVVLQVGYKITGNNVAAAVIWFLLAAAMSIGAAHVFCNVIERPSIWLASKLKCPDHRGIKIIRSRGILSSV